MAVLVAQGQVVVPSKVRSWTRGAQWSHGTCVGLSEGLNVFCCPICKGLDAVPARARPEGCEDHKEAVVPVAQGQVVVPRVLRNCTRSAQRSHDASVAKRVWVAVCARWQVRLKQRS